MSIVVGVDVGSRSTRVVALRPDGTVAGSAGAAYDDDLLAPDGRVDPQIWRRAVAEALGRLHETAPEAGRPAALAVGGQSPTAVPTAGGQAVTYSHLAAAGADFVSQQQAQRAVLEEEHPEAEVCQLWDWLLMSLGASRHQGRWPDDHALDGYGPVHPTGGVVGRATGEWGLARGTPLVAGAPDAFLTFWAAGLDQPRRGCDPGGRTGGLVVATTDGRPLPRLLRMPSPAEGCSIVGGPVSAHGLALEWLVKVSGRSLSELLDLAHSVPPGAGGVTFLPFLEGERTPRWQRGLRAQFDGLGLETGVAELARAVLEGTAYGLGHIACQLRTAGVAFDVVTCTGSPSRSRLWCEIKASVLGVPLEIPAFSELSAYGAALAAGAGAGWWPGPRRAGPGSWPGPAKTVVDPVAVPVYGHGLDNFIALGDELERKLAEGSPVGEGSFLGGT